MLLHRWQGIAERGKGVCGLHGCYRQSGDTLLRRRIGLLKSFCIELRMLHRLCLAGGISLLGLFLSLRTQDGQHAAVDQKAVECGIQFAGLAAQHILEDLAAARHNLALKPKGTQRFLKNLADGARSEGVVFLVDRLLEDSAEAPLQRVELLLVFKLRRASHVCKGKPILENIVFNQRKR